MKKSILIISLFLLLFNIVSAKTINNYSVYRIFDLKPEETNWSLKVIPETHKVVYEIKMREKDMNKYFSPKILLVGENFQDLFRKDIKSYDNGIRVIGENLDNIPVNYFKVFYTDKTNREYKKNTGLFNFSNLKDGINNITFCVQDTSFNDGTGIYIFLRCDKNTKKLYYIQETNQIVDESKYKNYLQEKEEYNNQQREKELAFLEKTNKYFDENKVEKSRFGTRSRIKTSKELQDLIINDLENVDFSKTSLDGLVASLSDKYFTYDDNDRVFANYTDFKNYVLYTIKEYIYQKEHPETNQNSSTTTTENKLNNNSSSDIEKFKEQNAKDRAKAIDFSKNLLKILEKYKTKEEKLEKLEYIKEIINTKYTPEKFKNQNLIGYVKDYLDIVEYAINLQ